MTLRLDNVVILKVCSAGKFFKVRNVESSGSCKIKLQDIAPFRSPFGLRHHTPFIKLWRKHHFLIYHWTASFKAVLVTDVGDIRLTHLHFILFFVLRRPLEGPLSIILL